MPSWIKIMLALIAWAYGAAMWENPWASWPAVGAAVIALCWWLDECQSDMPAMHEINTMQREQEWSAFAERAERFFRESPQRQVFADGDPSPSALLALKLNENFMLIVRVSGHDRVRKYATAQPLSSRNKWSDHANP